MFQINIEPDCLPYKKASKVRILLLNRNHDSPLVIHFRFDFPNDILHIGGSIRSVTAISLAKGILYEHQIKLKPQRLGESILSVKITCLNLRDCNQAINIPFQVVEVHQKDISGSNGLIENNISMLPNDISHESNMLIVQLIKNHFSASELNELCFKVGIEYEDISGQTRAEKALELVKYFDRRQELKTLVHICRKERPNLEWPETMMD